MKLGLLSLINKEKASTRKQPNHVSYTHKSLQEFGASKFICNQLETATDVKAMLMKFFPSIETVRRNKQVIMFTVGLMKDPTPLVDHIYSVEIEEYVNMMRKGDIPVIKSEMFYSFHNESTFELHGHPLHNKYINVYNHKLTPGDITPVYMPSKMYLFFDLRAKVVMDQHGHEAEIPECTMVVHHLNPTIMKSILFTCRTISQRQTIIYLDMSGVKYRKLADPDLFSMSKNASSVKISKSKLPCEVMTHLLQQLSVCNYLLDLTLSRTHLGIEAGCHLVQAIKCWKDSATLLNLNLSRCLLTEDMCAELLQSLSACNKLILLDLSHNSLTGCLSSFLPDTHLGLPELEKLILRHTALNLEDLQQISRITQCNKLPKLRILDLSYNTLTGCFSNFLPDPHPGLPQLQILYLSHTFLNKEDLQHFLRVAYKLPKLLELELSDYTLTGCLSSFLPDPHPGFPELKELYLDRTSLDREDLKHLTHLMRSRKLPALTILQLDEKRFCEIEEELGELLKTCMSHHRGELRIHFGNKDLPGAFVQKWEQCSEGTDIAIHFGDIHVRTGWLFEDEDENIGTGNEDDEEETMESDAESLNSEATPLHIPDDMRLSDDLFAPQLPSAQVITLCPTAFIEENLQYLSEISKNNLSQLKVLDLSGSILKGCFSTFLPDPHPGLLQLEVLRLQFTALTKDNLMHLSNITQNKKLPKLQVLDLSHNTLTGFLSSFLPDPHPGLPQLEELHLSETSLNRDDLQHLTQLIFHEKLTGLHKLDLLLIQNRQVKKQLGELTKVCVSHHQRKLQLWLGGNDLSKAFRNKLKESCEGTNVELLNLDKLAFSLPISTQFC